GSEIHITYGTLADSPNYTTLREIDADNFYSQINRPFGATYETDNPAPVLEMAGPSSIVTQVETSAPTASDPDHLNRVSYYYHHARFQAGGRGYLGFEKLATVDERTGIRTE